MNLVASEPALIGIDWGTTSLRAFLIDSHGHVLDSVNSSEGITRVPVQSFEAVLDRLISPWCSKPHLPILASGMITSKNGWVETPYASMPLSAGNLAQALVPLDIKFGARVHFVTGVSVEHTGGPDVMRGEETQIIGASDIGLNEGTFVMPGTHCKWVKVVGGKIVDFCTFMTGEIYNALSQHTILGTLMEYRNFDLEAFKAGVSIGLDSSSNLLQNLFHVRTLPLLNKMPKTAVADYLSGMLIGTEVASASKNTNLDLPITLVGQSELCERYQIALKLVGLKSRHAPENIVAKGHFLIARAAGLIR